MLGDTTSKAFLLIMARHGIGRMFANRDPVPQEGEPWALDNGAFAAWRAGRPWEPVTFTGRLEAYPRDRPPMFVVCPDKPADPDSLAHSLAWVERYPRDDYYLAVQDGMTVEDVRPVLPRFTGIFLGGTVRFKSTARVWCDLAHRYEIGFHYARAATVDRLCAAFEMGADSCDTSQPLWGWDRFNRFVATVRDFTPQRELFHAT